MLSFDDSKIREFRYFRCDLRAFIYETRWQLFKLGESIDGVRTLCKYGNHVWKIRVLKMSIKVMMIDER